MKIFFHTLRRLPNYKLVLSLTVISGVIEGFGISLFIPLINISSGAIGAPWPISAIIDVLKYFGIENSIWLITVLIVCLLSFSFYLIYIQNIQIAKSKLKLQNSMRKVLVQNLLDSSWSYYKKQSNGEIINRLTVQVERSASCISHCALTIASFLQMIIYLSISIILTKELTAVVFVLISLMSMGSFLVTKKAAAFGKESTSAYSKYSSKLSEYIGGLKLIKVMSLTNLIRERVNLLSDKIYLSYLNEDSSHAILALYMRIVPVFIVSAIIIISFEILDVKGSILLAFLFVLMRIVPSITAVRQNYHSTVIYKKSLNLIDEMTINAFKAKEKGLEKKLNIKFDNKIEIKNISYAYPQSELPVLNNISLTINKNSTVAIVGASGSGKTTLLDIIVGLYNPSSGSISIDGININNINLESWRKNIGYVTQDVLIFNESLNDNLMLRSGEVAKKDFANILRTAHLDKVIQKLPNGMSTNLGEGGARMSGGEKQRVAFARALMSDASVLILDEATSALDAKSESIIQSRIDEVSKKFTTIVVTHRLSTVKDVDVIYVLEDGKLSEYGSFNELIDKRGVFFNMYELQNKNKE